MLDEPVFALAHVVLHGHGQVVPEAAEPGGLLVPDEAFPALLAASLLAFLLAPCWFEAVDGGL